jgi:hypothetical protein
MFLVDSGQGLDFGLVLWSTEPPILIDVGEGGSFPRHKSVKSVKLSAPLHLVWRLK